MMGKRAEEKEPTDTNQGEITRWPQGGVSALVMVKRIPDILYRVSTECKIG